MWWERGGLDKGNACRNGKIWFLECLVELVPLVLVPPHRSFRLARVAGSPHGHESLAAVIEITTILSCHVCVYVSVCTGNACCCCDHRGWTQ
jgi:hypothetical protein